MFTEDKIKKAIQDNCIKEHNVSYIVSFDSSGDVKVTEAKDFERDVIDSFKEKIEDLEDEKSELEKKLENLENKYDDLEEEYSLLEG